MMAEVKVRTIDEINWVQSLSLPDLLRIARGCQKFAEEGKSCEECTHFKRNKCSGRDIIL